MTDISLTEQEELAFNQDVTKNIALDYFYNFDNSPLHFAYPEEVFSSRNELTAIEPTKIERRNKEIVEQLWLNAYNIHIIGEKHIQHLYEGVGALQSPLQSYLFANTISKPEREERNGSEVSFEQVKDRLEKSLAEEGWQAYEAARRSPTQGFEARILFGSPDRTMRLVSVTPCGNQVILEAIVTWTEDGVLRETAFAACLVFHVDGTIVLDRSYICMQNWPGAVASWFHEYGFEKIDPAEGQAPGKIADAYEHFRDKYIASRELSDREERNCSLTEGTWVDSYNSADLTETVFHPDRYRAQLPIQKVSYSRSTAERIEQEIKQSVPDREMKVLLTSATGNHVIAECLMTWSDQGVHREIPFIAFLLFDDDGLIIRERRYFDADYWPGSDKLILP